MACECFYAAYPVIARGLFTFISAIGKEGFEKIFQMSIQLHDYLTLENIVNIATAIQEKTIIYLTDSKLAIHIINRLNKLAKFHGILQSRSNVKKVKQLRLANRYFRHAKRRVQAR